MSYTLLLAVIEFKTAFVRGGVEIAKPKVLPKIPKSEHNELVRFLESQGLRVLYFYFTPTNIFVYSSTVLPVACLPRHVTDNRPLRPPRARV